MTLQHGNERSERNLCFSFSHSRVLPRSFLRRIVLLLFRLALCLCQTSERPCCFLLGNQFPRSVPSCSLGYHRTPPSLSLSHLPVSLFFPDTRRIHREQEQFADALNSRFLPACTYAVAMSMFSALYVCVFALMSCKVMMMFFPLCLSICPALPVPARARLHAPGLRSGRERNTGRPWSFVHSCPSNHSLTHHPQTCAHTFCR